MEEEEDEAPPGSMEVLDSQEGQPGPSRRGAVNRNKHWDPRTELLIHAVRAEESLWDKKSKKFNIRRSAKELAWGRVAANVDMEVEEAKKLWIATKGYWQQRRRIVGPPSGSGAGDDIHYGPYGLAMRFLKPIVERGETRSSTDFQRPPETSNVIPMSHSNVGPETSQSLLPTNFENIVFHGMEGDEFQLPDNESEEVTQYDGMPTLQHTLQQTQQQTQQQTLQQTLQQTQQLTQQGTQQQTLQETIQQTQQGTLQETIQQTQQGTQQQTQQGTQQLTQQGTQQGTQQRTQQQTQQRTLHETPQRTLHETPQRTLHETQQQGPRRRRSAQPPLVRTGHTRQRQSNTDPYGERILEELDNLGGADDHNRAFGLYVGTELRRFDEQTAKRKRWDILQILYE